MSQARTRRMKPQGHLLEIGQRLIGSEAHWTYADVLGLPLTKPGAKYFDPVVISVFEVQPGAEQSPESDPPYRAPAVTGLRRSRFVDSVRLL